MPHHPLSRVVLLTGLIALALSCNSRSPIFDSPISPTPTASALPGGEPNVLGLSFSPPAVNGGGTSLATVTLTLPALPPGTVVRLSTTDPSTDMPASITVPPGAARAEFFVATQPTPGDRQVVVTASTTSRSESRELAVWADLPMSLSLISDPDDFIGRGVPERFIPDNATFSASCLQSELSITARRTILDSFTMNFGAPRGQPLRVGTFEGATRTAFRNQSQPGIDVSGRGRGCNQTTGRFVVHEIEWAGNSVRSFRATFEQHCEGSAPALRGEIHVANVPLSANSSACVR